MPAHLPEPTRLPRLNAPAKGGAWALWHRLQPKRGRRMAFSQTMLRDDIDDDERVSRLRTLVDMGLWGDHRRRKDFAMDRDALGFDILHAQRECLCTRELLHLALEAGADPNWHENNHYDDSLLTLFARHNLPDCMFLVLQAGANPRWRDTCDKTALHLLVERASMDAEVKTATLPLIEQLLASGVDLNDRGESRHNDMGAPPIQDAIEKWDVELVRWMLARGARLDVHDQQGDTPFHWVASALTSAQLGWGEPEVEGMLDLLVAHGANVDTPNRRGETPVWTAMKWHHEDVGGWLLEHGASAACVPHTLQDSQGYEFRDKPGESLLQVFCENIALTPRATSLIPLLIAGAGQAPTTPDGVELHEALLATNNPWATFIEAQVLEQTVQSIDPKSPPSRRLRL